jgi:hypothetical protein
VETQVRGPSACREVGGFQTWRVEVPRKPLTSGNAVRPYGKGLVAGNTRGNVGQAAAVDLALDAVALRLGTNGTKSESNSEAWIDACRSWVVIGAEDLLGAGLVAATPDTLLSDNYQTWKASDSGHRRTR